MDSVEFKHKLLNGQTVYVSAYGKVCPAEYYTPAEVHDVRIESINSGEDSDSVEIFAASLSEADREDIYDHAAEALLNNLRESA